MTDPRIQWDPVFPISIVVAFGVVMLVVLVVLEYRRKMKFRTPRIIAQALFMVSLTCLVLRPSWRSNQPQNGLLLLTPGYDKAQVATVLQEHPTLQIKLSPGAAAFPGASTFADYHDLAAQGTRISAVVGDGLPGWALEMLHQPDYNFLSSESRGLTRINADQLQFANRWNAVEGLYHAIEPTWIRLRGPAGIDDSVRVDAGDSKFRLEFFAKSPGRFTYDVETPEGVESLPVHILPERLLEIVIMNDYPTFESRFLKNFLASSGHRIVVRTKVSKEKFKFEFSNHTPSEFKQLTTKLLSETDLLVLDARTFETMPANEQRTVRTAINAGLGVILLPDPSVKKGAALLSFATTNDADTSTINLPHAKSVQLPVLPLRPTEQVETVLESNHGKGLTGFKTVGSGKLGFTLIRESYQLGLQSRSEDYASLWTPLIEKCARTGFEDFQIKIKSPFPRYVDEPIKFEILSSGTVPSVKVDGTLVPVAEDLRVDDVYQGTLWAGEPGWHELKTDSTSHWFYVSTSSTWPTLRAEETRTSTARLASTEWHERAPMPVHNRQIPTIILFILFVCAAGFLWLAPKL